jgi:hypothetical protein
MFYVYVVGLENECWCVQREERSVDEGETKVERCPGIKNACERWVQLNFAKKAFGWTTPEQRLECKIGFLMRYGLAWS